MDIRLVEPVLSVVKCIGDIVLAGAKLLKFEVMDGLTPSNARVERRSRYFNVSGNPVIMVHQASDNGSLLRNRVTEAVQTTFAFLAYVIWIHTYKY